MSDDLANSYAIRPNFRHKFRPATVKGLIHDTLNEELGGKKYEAEEAKGWPKLITDAVLLKMKELDLDRYKYVVQVVIGEQRGEGVNVGCRCLWDSDTDNFAQDLLMTIDLYENKAEGEWLIMCIYHGRKILVHQNINDTFFCVAAVYGVFYY